MDNRYEKKFLILISILGLSASSCSYFESFSEKRKELEETSKPTIKIKAKAEGQEEAKEAEEKDPLAKAVEEAEGVKREQDVVGLIASTKPEIRVRGSVRGRQDPFSTVAVKPNIEIEEEVTAEDNSRASQNQGRSSNNRPENITSTPTIETLEAPEDTVSPTELAEKVLITGLVELGDRIKLIVQAPGEATSRYVDIGQYIANGRVLIKRIESNFPVPTVILEQDGIEVSRLVGQPVEEEDEEQAMLPPPPPSTATSVSWLSNYLAEKSDNSITR
ncbi:hypothetical protein [Hyella patelloides]|uniref:hypothetical protein n=1 Tax=Hyella patelloides TaxID=1982969 RepID=UPI0011A4037C|nr:hypothetical protein [Hyella patelloides]